VARRSRDEPATGADILLIDTLGETGPVFRVAPLAFLGGSFGPEGGHNPWEPARLGAAVLAGPNTASHRAAYARLTGAGAARIVADEAALARAVAALVGSPALDAMREAARAVASEPAEIRSQTLALLLPLITGRP